MCNCRVYFFLFFSCSTGKSMSKDIQQDETKVENISIKCRPSVIAEEYHNHSFQTASLLKQQLSKSGERVENQYWQRYICAIYMVGVFLYEIEDTCSCF